MDKVALSSLIIFTDGACSGNPGPGGWGTVIVDPEKGFVKELGGGVDETTNNRMEIAAALRGLDAVAAIEKPVVIYTDSTYLIRGITQWIWGWRKRGWKTAEGKDVINKDLFNQMDAVLRARPDGCKVTWNYVRGHRGNPGNERCDEIAVGFSQGRRVSLYDGSLLQYSIAIMDLPETQELPEMKSPAEKKPPAHSYLSLVNGVVTRHPDWPSCERATKGRSGAKFKKAQTSGDEAGILSEWKLAPNTPIRDQ